MTMNTSKKEATNDKEVHVMPPIELIESERAAYVRELEEYLLNLKKMSKKEAQKISKENLIKSQILQEDGEFAAHYQLSKANAHKKR